MTEITDRKVLDLPRYNKALVHKMIGTQRRPGYLIDPVAFFIGLIGGPLLVTLLTFWLVIPMFALFLGGPFYLMLGTPVLLWHLRRHPPEVNRIAFLGMSVVLMMFPFAMIWIWVNGQSGGILMLAFFGGISLLFAMLWAGAFAWIYLKLRGEFYAVARA